MIGINQIAQMGRVMVDIMGTLDDLIFISVVRLIDVYGIDENESMENLVGITEQITAMELGLA